MILNYDEVGKEINKIDGLISPDESRYLFNLTHNTSQESIIVEIGSHTGKSSVSIGMACIGTKRKLYCIDLWGNEVFYTKWKENIANFKLNDCVIPIQGWSGDILANWETIGKGMMIDFLFLDGSHGISDVAKDFCLAYHWLKFEGTVAFHDVGHPIYPGVAEFWNVIKNILTYHVKMGSIASGRKMLIK
jgi:predicted O-methyltransferase YrrM